LRQLIITSTFLLLILSGASIVGAQAPTGSFTVNRGKSDDINAAIEQAISQANYVIRPILRGRLRHTNPLHNTVSISHTGGKFTIRFDIQPAMTSPDTGAQVKFTDLYQETFELSTQLNGSSLVQTLRGEDQTTISTFRLSANRLKISVTVQSPSLPKPLTYALVYDGTAQAARPRANRPGAKRN